MNLMKNLTRKLGSIDGSEDDLLKMFEFEKELAKVHFILPINLYFMYLFSVSISTYKFEFVIIFLPLF